MLSKSLPVGDQASRLLPAHGPGTSRSRYPDGLYILVRRRGLSRAKLVLLDGPYGRQMCNMGSVSLNLPRQPVLSAMLKLGSVSHNV